MPFYTATQQVFQAPQYAEQQAPLSDEQLLALKLHVNKDLTLVIGELTALQVLHYSALVDRQCDYLVDEYEELTEGVEPAKRGEQWSHEMQVVEYEMDRHANLQKALELRDTILNPIT